MCGDRERSNGVERVVGVQQGVEEESDLDSLFRTHAGRLRRMLSSMRPGAGRRHSPNGAEDVDDLVQETFLRALRRGSDLPPPSDRTPYLFAIARNLYIDRLRRRGQLSIELDAQIAEHAWLAPQEEDRELQEGVERLARYVETLQASLRLLYETRFVRGLSQRDAARELAVSRRHVRTLEGRLLAGAARALQGE